MTGTVFLLRSTPLSGHRSRERWPKTAKHWGDNLVRSADILGPPTDLRSLVHQFRNHSTPDRCQVWSDGRRRGSVYDLAGHRWPAAGHRRDDIVYGQPTAAGWPLHRNRPHQATAVSVGGPPPVTLIMIITQVLNVILHVRTFPRRNATE